MAKKEFIEIKLVEEKSKTKVYDVINKKEGYVLGQIKWNSSWRKYCFEPTSDFSTTFDDQCLFMIARFILRTNEEYRKEKSLRDDENMLSFSV